MDLLVIDCQNEIIASLCNKLNFFEPEILFNKVIIYIISTSSLIGGVRILTSLIGQSVGTTNLSQALPEFCQPHHKNHIHWTQTGPMKVDGNRI